MNAPPSSPEDSATSATDATTPHPLSSAESATSATSATEPSCDLCGQELLYPRSIEIRVCRKNDDAHISARKERQNAVPVAYTADKRTA